jgi:hypothetical protein
MNVALRDVLTRAFEYWNCPIRQEERNLFRVEIEPGSIAEAVCEAAGTVYIGIVEFEDDVVAAYESWRSFTPGSYYLHRLLERLGAGPVTGRTYVSAGYQSPDSAELFPLEQFDSAQCRLDGPLEQTELSVAATTFHFAVTLLGLEPTTELVSLTVEPLRLNLLPEPASSDPAAPEARSPSRLHIEETFPVAAAGLKDAINELLDKYKRKRSGVTAQAVRRIRAAKKADLASQPRAKNDLELSRRRAEVEEIWTIREQDARIRGEAERVDAALVAATIQERPMTLYKAKLVLPESRERILVRLYDRATGWREPWRCEVCRQVVDAFIPGGGPCQHLLCSNCALHADGCLHAFCAGCARRCGQCDELVCPACERDCISCGNVFCPVHRSTCAVCSSRTCSTCSQPCPSCAKRLCPAHGAACPICEQIMCPSHRKHKNEIGIYRMSMTTYNRLRLENVTLDAEILNRQFRGRRSFLEALRALLNEELYNEYKSILLKHAEKCYDIWFELYLEELAEYVVEFNDSKTAFRPENWLYPFYLSPEDREMVWASRYMHRKNWISLDDHIWWLQRSVYWPDPFLNEYGFLPSEHELNETLEGVDADEVLRRGWFEHSAHSDPTYETIPFYDPGALDDLISPGLVERLLK